MFSSFVDDKIQSDSQNEDENQHSTLTPFEYRLREVIKHVVIILPRVILLLLFRWKPIKKVANLNQAAWIVLLKTFAKLRLKTGFCAIESKNLRIRWKADLKRSEIHEQPFKSTIFKLSIFQVELTIAPRKVAPTPPVPPPRPPRGRDEKRRPLTNNNKNETSPNFCQHQKGIFPLLDPAKFETTSTNRPPNNNVIFVKGESNFFLF